MREDIICIIEEPPILTAELNEVKVEWQNQKKEYEGSYEIKALDYISDGELETKDCQLDKNIKIIGHGLIRGQIDLGEVKEGYWEITPMTTEQVFDISKQYNKTDTKIKILPSDYEPWEGRYEFQANASTQMVISSIKKGFDDNIIIMPPHTEEYKTSGTDGYTYKMYDSVLPTASQ